MYLTLADTIPDTQQEVLGSGVHRSWLATREFGESLGSQVSVLTIPPATTYSLEAQDGRERICVLIRGRAELLVNDGATAIAEGEVVHSTTGRAFTVRTDESSAVFLVLSASTSSQQQDGAPTESVSSVEYFSLYEIQDEVLHQPAIGFFNMGTRMLLNAAKGGYQSFIFGQSSFAPQRGVHALHRHPSADELFYVWEGEGAHLEENGKEHPMRHSDAVFVPRNEWHGFRNIGDRPVRAFFCLIGTGDMRHAGNEVRENGRAVNTLSKPILAASAPKWMKSEHTDQ